MSIGKRVRIHLRQAILVGCGDQARYSKVLVGEEQITPLKRGSDIFMSVNVIGFVLSYQGHNLTAPIEMLLSTNNILAIEYMEVERHSEPIMWCKVRRAEEPFHPPHHYHGRQGQAVHCPGWEPD